jgi:RNA polymerase sigma-70 factor, ECF subfamily
VVPFTPTDNAAWETLYAGAKRGDAVALRDFCVVARPMLVRASASILGSRDDADDVAQDALIKALTTPRLFAGRGSLQGWLLRIAMNLAKNRRRDAARRRQLVEGATHAALWERGALARAVELPDAHLDVHAQQAALSRGLSTLSERQRDVVMLRVAGEMDFAAIGAALSMREENARVTFSQAKQKLMRAVEAQP